MSDWLDRELNPATPPWLTVRFYLAVAAVVLSVAALVISAGTAHAAGVAPAYWDQNPSYACSQFGCMWFQSSPNEMLVKTGNLDFTQLIALPNHQLQWASNHTLCLTDGVTVAYQKRCLSPVVASQEWTVGPYIGTVVSYYNMSQCMTAPATGQKITFAGCHNGQQDQEWGNT